MSATPDVGENLARVRERIAAAAHRVGREPEAITLVGVSKRIALPRVVAAVEAGLEHLGENYVQAARRVIPALAAAVAPGTPLHWHMIGHLQRNKARDAVQLFQVVETVDRLALARELARRAAANGTCLQVLLQANLSGEAQKSGVAPAALGDLLAACAGLEALEVVGLMTIPALSHDPEATRPVFARLRELRDELRQRPEGAGLRHLSMGMSADFEIAVEEGATIVRVGTAIFGAREEAA